MDSLPSLITRIQDGDLKAFGTLVYRFQDMAVGYAYTIIGDFHHAEDAAQEAFLNVYQDLDQLRNPEAFPAWLRQIVFKHCDRFTRRKRINTVPLDHAFEIPSLSNSPNKIVEEKILAEQVYDIIEDSPQQATGNLESVEPRLRRGIFGSPLAYPRSKLRGRRFAVLFNPCPINNVKHSRCIISANIPKLR